MAKLDAKKSNRLFDMTDPSAFRFDGRSSYVVHSPTSYVYDSPDGNRVLITGSGIRVGANDLPIAGTVKVVSLDYDHNRRIDAVITDLDLPLRTLLASPDAFWKVLLSGDDKIYAPGVAHATLFGDGLKTTGPGVIRSGDDTLVGGKGGATFYGDFRDVTLSVKLGNDHIFLKNIHDTSLAIGDALRVSASAIGGNDSIVDSQQPATVIGDARTVTGGHFVGGNDRLTCTNGGPNTIVGDVQFVDRTGSASPTIQGGNDTITGGPLVYGDFQTVSSKVGPNTLVCGDDRIFAGGRIWGDGVLDSAAFKHFGDDKIYTYGSADLIYGDTATFRSISQLALSVDVGGNDTIESGGGDDRIFGGYGRDLIDAGSGNDAIDGGRGNDTIFGGHGIDSITGGYGDDILTGGRENWLEAGVEDRFIFAIKSGRDTIADFEDNIDTLRISAGYGFADADAVAAATTANANDAIIHLSATDTITLTGFLAAHTINDLKDDIVIF